LYGGIGGALFVWPSYAVGGPAGQAYLAWSGALLVRSGGVRESIKNFFEVTQKQFGGYASII